MKHTETRWALAVKINARSFLLDGKSFLLGRFCWKDGKADDQNIRTFRTRKQAREAKKDLTSYRTAQTVKVRVTVETDE